MEIKKKIDGYTIELNFNEYNDLKDVLLDAIKYYSLKFDINLERYDLLFKEMEKSDKRYLTSEEAKPLVNCMCCKNCLLPFYRENGRLCKLEKCDFNPA